MQNNLHFDNHIFLFNIFTTDLIIRFHLIHDSSRQQYWFDMIYLLTVIGSSAGGSTHLHTNNIQNNTNNNQTTQIITTKKHKYNGRVRAVPRLCEFYPGICLTTEEKARKNLSQGRKNLSHSTVYILSKTHTHITKPSQTHTLQNPLIHTHAHKHTTKQYKTTSIQIKTKCIQEKQEYLVSNVQFDNT